MTKVNDLRNTVFDAIMEFYQEHMKPETRQMVADVVEEVVDRKLDEKLDRKFEEKFDEHLGPMKASLMTLEKNVSLALGDYQGQQIQLSDHGKRLTTLEGKVLHR